MKQAGQEERVAELVLRLHQMAQEAFAEECSATDQEKNMAVLASALVRAGIRVMVGFCPREKLGQAMKSLAYQINQALAVELGPPLSQGEGGLLVNGSAANDSGGEESVVGQVEGEIGEPQNQPKK